MVMLQGTVLSSGNGTGDEAQTHPQESPSASDRPTLTSENNTASVLSWGGPEQPPKGQGCLPGGGPKLRHEEGAGDSIINMLIGILYNKVIGQVCNGVLKQPNHPVPNTVIVG